MEDVHIDPCVLSMYENVAKYRNLNLNEVINQALHESLNQNCSLLPSEYKEMATLRYGSIDVTLPVVDGYVSEAPLAILQLESLLILCVELGLEGTLEFVDGLEAYSIYASGANPYAMVNIPNINLKLLGIIQATLNSSVETVHVPNEIHQ